MIIWSFLGTGSFDSAFLAVVAAAVEDTCFVEPSIAAFGVGSFVPGTDSVEGQHTADPWMGFLEPETN